METTDLPDRVGTLNPAEPRPDVMQKQGLPVDGNHRPSPPGRDALTRLSHAPTAADSDTNMKSEREA